jgi:hypothetical protein
MTDFTWVDSINLSGTLIPEEEAILDIKACFYRKGTYDVNRW